MRALVPLLVLVTAGCTTGVDGGGQPDAQGAIDSPIIEGDPLVEWFTGRVATTPTVPFGGPPYCNYSMRLSDVRFDVTMHPTDGLSSILVGDTTNEATVGTCMYAPSPMSRQGFAYLGIPQPAGADGAFTPMLQGLPTNSPTTAITVSITRTGADTLASTARWDRTDLGAPLAWSVATQSPIALTRRTCQVGGIYCLGGSSEGLLYRCVDGRQLTRFKVCAPGCVPVEPPRMPHVDERCN